MCVELENYKKNNKKGRIFNSSVFFLFKQDGLESVDGKLVFSTSKDVVIFTLSKGPFQSHPAKLYLHLEGLKMARDLELVLN